MPCLDIKVNENAKARVAEFPDQALKLSRPLMGQDQEGVTPAIDTSYRIHQTVLFRSVGTCKASNLLRLTSGGQRGRVFYHNGSLI